MDARIYTSEHVRVRTRSWTGRPVANSDEALNKIARGLEHHQYFIFLASRVQVISIDDSHNDHTTLVEGVYCLSKTYLKMDMRRGISYQMCCLLTKIGAKAGHSASPNHRLINGATRPLSVVYMW